MERTSVRVALQARRLLIREVFAACLRSRPDFTVVGHAADLVDLAVVCDLRRPDVVLVDLRDHLPGLTDSLRELHERFKDVGLVGIYDSAQRLTLHDLCEAGLTAAVPASHGLDALLVTLRRHAAQRALPPGGRLTDGDLDVLWLMNSGHSVAEMASVLGISPGAVENRKRRIYAKLDTHSNSQAVARIASLGIAHHRKRNVRAAAEAGRAAVVLLRGHPGPVIDLVAGTLVTRGVPYVHDRSCGAKNDEYPAYWYPGPVIGVLVDPSEADWTACDALGIPVLLVCDGFPERGELLAAMQRGAWAVLAAQDVPADLVTVIAVLVGGYAAIRADQLGSDAGMMLDGGGLRVLPELTVRETEILYSVGRGDSVRQTARALGIATKTVENTQARIFRKLGVRNRAAALSIAYRLGLLTDGREPPRARA